MTYAAGELAVKFKDWREQSVALRFPDAVAFRWEDEAAPPTGVRDDTSYEVVDSAWIAELRSAGTPSQALHHYMLCFNAAGLLHVVSARLLVAASPER
ncbi:MAG: hypothetical protein ACAI43_21580 [Phycisphaerae bacterium]|nr:hypothetical protein [Tepidisphaeraceae bacterium]